MLHPLEGPIHPTETVTVLIADHDPSRRSLLSMWLRHSVAGAEGLQAVDGAHAVQLGIQRDPQIALLDVCMPRLGGIEAALTLGSLRPAMEIALQSADAEEHRVRAAAIGLPLFDKRDLQQSRAWIKARVRALVTLDDVSPADEGPVLLSSAGERRCSRCEYRIASVTTPVRCPMCQTSNPWVSIPKHQLRAVALDRRI